jgi:hypothetical protein
MMKPLNFKITNRSLLGLMLVCIVGAPIVGIIGSVSSQIFHQLLGKLFPAPIILLFTWTTLVILSALLFGRVVWFNRIQHPWIVGGCGGVFGVSVYLTFLIFSSRFLPDTGMNPMSFGWQANLPILVSLIGMLLIPNIAQSREPVCENCQRWYGVAQHVGNVSFPQREEFLFFIDRGQLYEAGNLVVEEDEAAPPNLEIYRQSCSECQMSDHVIIVKETFLNAQGMVKRRVLRRGIVSFSQSKELLRQMTGVKNR